MNILKWGEVEEKASKDYSSFVYNCEYNFQSQIHQIADDVFERAHCKLILVAGPSASGKTTFTNILAEDLEKKGIKVHRLSTDDFFKNRSELKRLPSGQLDFDSLDAMDVPLLRKTVKLILAGGTVSLPEFDFKTGVKTLNAKTINVQDSDITIVEGIHALNPAVLGTFGMSSKLTRGVFIRPAKTIVMEDGTVISPNDLRLLRRSIRDVYTRNYSLEQTLNQWDDVLKAEQEFIYPFRDLAEYSVNSLHPYELYVYKNCFGKILEECELERYQNLKNALAQIVKKPRVEIPKSSLLNEFDIWGEDK